MNIPKLNRDDVDEAIKKIKLLDVKTAEIGEILLILEPLFNGYTLEAPIYKPPLYLYRGRICAKPKTLGDLSYPPSKCVNSYGRINDIKESIFYSSTGKNAPFFEIKAKKGDYLAISCWKTKHKLTLNHVGFTNEVSNLLSSTRNLNKIYDFVNKSQNFGDLNNFVHSYLSGLFCKDVMGNEEYKLTVAISKKLFGDFFDGIMYPTIAMSGNVDNIELTKDYVDQHIQFVYVEYVKITKVVGINYSYDVLETCTTMDGSGNLNWNNRTLNWQIAAGKQLKMKSLGNDWVAFDDSGKRIDPS